MALSKEQANAIFDALTVPARQERVRQAAIREAQSDPAPELRTPF